MDIECLEILKVYIKLVNESPLAKYLSVLANLMRQELLRNTLYLSFGLLGQFSGAKSQSHFGHPDEIPKS
jgi:hypothetical protein